MDAYLLAFGSTSPASGSTNYGTVDGVQRGWLTSDIAASQPLPHALTVKNARIDLRTAPGAGKTWTFTLQKNGSDTTIVIAITGASTTSGTDILHSVSFAAGDTISWKCVPTSNPSVTNWGASFSLVQTATSQFAVLFSSTTAITATTFESPSGGNASTTETQVYAPMPFGGTVKNLYVKSDVDPNPGNWTVTMRKNAADTSPALTCNLPSGQTAGTPVHDTTNAPTFAAGDQLALHVVAAATPASSRISGGFTVVPTTDGDACFLTSRSNNVSGSANNWAGPVGAISSWATSEVEGNPQARLQPCTIKAMYVKLSGGPSPGQYTFTLNDGGVGTAATFVVSGASTTGNITGLNVAVNAADLLDIASVPASSATARTAQFGIHYRIASDVIDSGSSSMTGVQANVKEAPVDSAKSSLTGVPTKTKEAPGDWSAAKFKS